MTSVPAVVRGAFDLCQNCGYRPLEHIMNFGHHPPCDALLRHHQLREPEAFYPLDLYRCGKCGLVQINYAVEPEELFYDAYPYRTGITDALKRNFDAMAAHTIEKIQLKPGSFVLDVGSNDGTLLEGFRARDMRVLGVEPTGIAEIANANGIPTLRAFFGEEVADKIRREHGAASLVTAANVFAHVANLGPCIQGIYKLLSDDGMFVSESHYLLDLVDTLQYDTIYHEHLRYYSVKPLVVMMQNYGFTIIDAERIPNHGGSIRVYAQKSRGQQPCARVKDLIEQEEAYGLYSPSIYKQFHERVLNSKWKLMRLLCSLKEEGYRIAGVGSPGRSSTIMNYCGIGPDIVDYIGEQPTSLKVGLYTPGTHVPVVDEQQLINDQPDYALVLAWHLGDSIPKKLRKKGLQSKFIMPLPEPVLLDW